MRYSFLVLFLLLSQFTYAQADSTGARPDSIQPVPFVAYWAKGDIYKFDITKIDFQVINGDTLKNDTTKTFGAFEVLDSTATSYTIKWSGRDVQIPNSELVYDVLEEAVAKVKPFENIIYTTDELGAFVKIDNIDEAVALSKQIYESLMDQPRFKAMPDSVKRKVIAIGHKNSTPEYLQATLFDYLQLIHYPYGVEYNPIDTLYYEEQIPGPAGVGSFTLNNKLFIDSLSATDSFIHLKQYSQADEASAKRVLKDYLVELGRKVGDEYVDESTYNIVNDNDYYFYYYPGIPVYVDYFRAVEFKTPTESSYTTKQILIEWVD